jgi:hypothetical protein
VTASDDSRQPTSKHALPAAGRHRFGPWLLLLCLTACNSSGPSPTQSRGTVCLDRAIFGDPAASPYVLPYRVGVAHDLIQSYCDATNSHRNQLAYDIRMAIGEDVLAIAAGQVREIKEDWPDDGISSQNHNYVLIEHADGTTAFYAHLMQWGVDVEVGDFVDQGQRFAASGMSAVPLPLLHLGVYRSFPPQEGNDLAINFRNAEGELDERGGLQLFVDYLARPH